MGTTTEIASTIQNTFPTSAFESSEKERSALLNEISTLKQRIIQLEHKADTDPLVSVYNRRAFMREIERAQTVMTRYNILSSVIFFDLNGFKVINDQYGHAIGDEILQKVGMALQGAVRDCDMVARIGGDEFGILLFKTDDNLTRLKADSLACRIADQKISHPDGDIQVTAAWGVSACLPENTPKQILDRADRQMYENKRTAL